MSGASLGGLGDLVPDRYDLNARLKPALLALLPALSCAFVWLPLPNSLSGVIVGLLGTCGVTLLLMHLARSAGRSLERKWGDAIGREHSARLLSHFNSDLRQARKGRVIQLVNYHGPGLPSAEEEATDPLSSNERRLDAILWLLEVTRADSGTSLLLAENIAYGFRRNLHGLKPLALAILVTVFAANLWLLGLPLNNDPRQLPAVGLCALCLIALWVWLFIVTKSWVVEASSDYAERLFAQVDNPALLARLEGMAVRGRIDIDRQGPV